MRRARDNGIVASEGFFGPEVGWETSTAVDELAELEEPYGLFKDVASAGGIVKTGSTICGCRSRRTDNSVSDKVFSNSDEVDDDSIESKSEAAMAINEGERF